MHMKVLVGALLASAVLGPVAPASAQSGTDDVTAGSRVYQNYCATCHGEELQNNSGVSFDLRRLRADEHPRFVSALENGKKAMPSWKGVLTEAQIEALWAYIRANANE